MLASRVRYEQQPLTRAPERKGATVININRLPYHGSALRYRLADEIVNSAAQKIVNQDVQAMPSDHELMDAKLKTAAAETDTKFAQILSEIRVNSTELRGEMGKITTEMRAVQRSTTGVKATIVGVALATVAIVVGILGFGQQWFGIGVTTRDIIRATVQEERIQHPIVAPSTPTK